MTLPESVYKAADQAYFHQSAEHGWGPRVRAAADAAITAYESAAPSLVAARDGEIAKLKAELHDQEDQEARMHDRAQDRNIRIATLCAENDTLKAQLAEREDEITGLLTQCESSAINYHKEKARAEKAEAALAAAEKELARLRGVESVVLGWQTAVGKAQTAQSAAEALAGANYKKLQKAERALLRAGYEPVDGIEGWKAPVGRRPASLSLQRYTSTPTGHHINDSDGRWILHADILAWERQGETQPDMTERIAAWNIEAAQRRGEPAPEKVSVREAALACLGVSVGPPSVGAIADAIAAGIAADREAK